MSKTTVSRIGTPPTPTETRDPVEYEPVILAVSKARAMAWVLEELGANEGCEFRNDLCTGLKGDHVPKDTHDWLQGVVGEALRAALDEIEREYRKPKDGA